MTTLEASAYLYRWFSENDTFCMKDDFIKVITLTETPSRDKATFLCALKQYEEGLFVDKADWEGETYWVLKKSFYTHTQQPHIPADLCLDMAELINECCDLMGIESDKCDPTRINEGDIRNLLSLARAQVKNTTDDEEEE